VLQEESAGADELPHILLELKQSSCGDVQKALDQISKEPFVREHFLCPMV